MKTRPRERRGIPKFISIRGGACSDNASVAALPSLVFEILDSACNQNAPCFPSVFRPKISSQSSLSIMIQSPGEKNSF